MANFVLVHGGWQGGWSYRRVARLLRQAGHEVYTPTLTGLGERSHLAEMPINLDTHITDIVNTILWEDLSDVVLVGHSYGGMVITGVADQISERISALVYLDALVPEAGDTLFTLRPEFMEPFVTRVATNEGLMVPPFPASAYDTSLPEDWAWIDEKTTPHPFACFVQPYIKSVSHPSHSLSLGPAAVQLLTPPIIFTRLRPAALLTYKAASARATLSLKLSPGR